MEPLTSSGNVLDTSPEKLGELRPSNDILDDVAALRRRMEEEGYLFLRNYLDRDVVMGARRAMLERLAAAGALDTSRPLMEAIFSGDERKMWERNLRKDLRTCEPVREMCQRGRIIQFFERFLGGEVLPLDHIWVRTVRTGAATGCHYDWVYMGRGTRNLYTSWIPVGDVPRIEGSLMILEDSHKLEELKNTYGTLDTERDKENNPYGGGWFSKNPAEVQARFGGRWLTTDFQAGDLLVFSMFTMHCSTDNRSPVNRVRLSTDSRYQLASEPVDERWMGI